MTKPAKIREAIGTATEIDYETGAVAAGHDDLRCTPWMPFPVFDFIAMTAEALLDANGDRFLEVGCGPGTRMLLAREIYGLEVAGIERVEEYAERGRKLGLDIATIDALEFGGYGNYDIIWFNRPFRDRDLQRQLEKKVWQDMAPGAVVMCANLEFPPPRQWILILDDWEVRRGIWRKPE